MQRIIWGESRSVSIPSPQYSLHEMKLIFIAGKYSAATWSGIEDNIRKADAIALKLVSAGWAVYCPHKNTAHWEVYEPFMGKGKQAWLDLDLEILRRCNAIFMLEGWRESEGAKNEYKEACNQDLEIYFEANGIPLPEGRNVVVAKHR